MIKLYNKNNPPERIAQIVNLLNDGGVIIYPTGTTYALGCHALKERAVERICRIRQTTPTEQQFAIVCYNLSAISEYAHISTKVYKVMKRNLPGPFTFILPGKRILPKIFRTRKSSEVGIRMPESELLGNLIEALDAPLLTASLPQVDDENDSAYFIDPELVDETFGNQVDLVIDGGYGTPGTSTIVDCTDDEITIVRQGDGELLL